MYTSLKNLSSASTPTTRGVSAIIAHTRLILKTLIWPSAPYTLRSMVCWCTTVINFLHISSRYSSRCIASGSLMTRTAIPQPSNPANPVGQKHDRMATCNYSHIVYEQLWEIVPSRIQLPHTPKTRSSSPDCTLDGSQNYHEQVPLQTMRKRKQYELQSKRLLSCLITPILLPCSIL